MGIYRGLVSALLQAGGLQPESERELFHSVQRKSQADIRALLDDSALAEMMSCLPRLMGDIAMLEQARDQLAQAPDMVLGAIDELERLAQRVVGLNGGVSVRLDVAELSGYGYHNGPVFAVYHPEHGSALAQGGRYDGVGEVFGRVRPATGFDVNLKNLLANSLLTKSPLTKPVDESSALDIVFAPFAGEQQSQSQAEVQRLRAAGQRVRCALSASEAPPDSCRRILALQNGSWQVIARDEYHENSNLDS